MKNDREFTIGLRIPRGNYKIANKSDRVFSAGFRVSRGCSEIDKRLASSIARVV